MNLALWLESTARLNGAAPALFTRHFRRAVRGGDQSAQPDLVEFGPPVDVELGHLGVGVAELVAVVVEPVLEHPDG